MREDIVHNIAMPGTQATRQANQHAMLDSFNQAQGGAHLAFTAEHF